jgi:hypothetical protein
VFAVIWKRCLADPDDMMLEDGSQTWLSKSKVWPRRLQDYEEEQFEQ